MINERVNLYYDPQRDGYDTTVWRTVTGTPNYSGGELSLNISSIIGYNDFMSGDLIMNLVIPAAPTAGDDRLFGFSQLNNGCFVGFCISGTVFTAKIIDSSGTSISDTAITWNAAWTNAVVSFRIHWTGFDAKFYINDTKVSEVQNVDKMKYPMSVYVHNNNADYLSIANIQMKGAEMFKSNKVNVGSLISASYDYILLSYTGTNPTTITYKSGGASGETVATLILTYDGSSNVTSITKS